MRSVQHKSECVGHRQVRYLIVWNPVIVGVTQLFLYETGVMKT